jgi:tetratricopeptide (TPR) repeat protein
MLDLFLHFPLIFSSIVFAEDPCQEGKAALAKGDFLNAISLLREGVRKDKKNFECYLNLGEALLKADSTDQAVAALVQARDIDSTVARVYDLQGDVYIKQKYIHCGVEQFQKAASLDSTNVKFLLVNREDMNPFRNGNSLRRFSISTMSFRATHLAVMNCALFASYGKWHNVLCLLATSTRGGDSRVHISLAIGHLGENRQRGRIN